MRRERIEDNDRLRVLVETNKLLNSSLEVDRVLEILLDTCVERIPGCDQVSVFLYNEETDFLEMRIASEGFGTRWREIKIKSGESMSGVAFARKQAMFFRDADAVRKASTSEIDDRGFFRLSNIDPKKLNGAISCPLISKDQVIGVMTLSNSNTSNLLVEKDVDFLEAIAVQATLAIVNAQSHEQQLEANQQLNHQARIIEDERNKYRYALEIHSRFTDMILSGKSIGRILEESKDLLGKDVFCVDALYTVIADTFEVDAESAQEHLPLLIKHFDRGRQSVCKIRGEELWIHVFPVVTSGGALGWFCVRSSSNSLEDLDRITAERAASIIALETLKYNEVFSMEQSLRGDYIEGLIQNTSPSYIEKCCDMYKVPQKGHFRSILIQLDFDSESRGAGNKEWDRFMIVKKMYDVMNREMKARFSNAFAAAKGLNIVIILSADSTIEKFEVDQFLDQVIKRFHEQYVHLEEAFDCRIAVGEGFKGIREFGRSYRNLEYAISYLQTYQQELARIHYEDLEIKRLLSKNSTKELKQFVESVLSPLLTYKGTSKEEFLHTLERYIKLNGSWSATKEALHIHGNTLTYRLSKIEKILGVNLREYNDRLKVQIAFEVVELLDGKLSELSWT